MCNVVYLCPTFLNHSATSILYFFLMLASITIISIHCVYGWNKMLTWMSLLVSTLCDPYLNIFRGIIPPLGGTLDLSPILAFLVLNAFTSVAAALPAELPSSQVLEDIPSPTTTSHLTASRKKWIRRLSGSKSRCSSREL
ncbi:hypothetical protein ACS0TY_020653 [Phlomoides rotata]